MIKKIICLMVVFAFVLTVTGCATIITGRNQKLPVLSNPSGAVVFVNGVRYTTPTTIILDRKEPSYQIRVEKEGYEPVDITLRKGVNGWIWGNALLGLFGGAIGLVIDIGTGAIHKFTPTEVNVSLVSQKLSSSDLKQLKDKSILVVKLAE